MASSKASQALNDLLEKDILPSDVEMQVDEGEVNDDAYVNNHVPSSQGMCSECGDQASSMACDQCQDEFCDMCYKAMHRKGARKQHTHKKLEKPNDNSNNNNNNNNNKDSSESESEEEEEEDDKMEGDDAEKKPDSDDDEASEPDLKRPSISRYPFTTTTSSYDRNYLMNNYTSFGRANSHYNKENNVLSNMVNQKPPPPPADKSPAEKYIPSVKKDGPWFEDRARYIPLRLTMDERKTLRLLEASLHVCDYTDRVDVPALAASKPKRIVQQLKEICALLCGIRASIDLESGKEMVVDRNFSEHSQFYQLIFEIGRRHKIMNPEKMRTEYGKLIYLLQDSMMPEIQDLIKFSMVHQVLTVHSYLKEKGGLAMLHDPFMEIATREIVPEGKDRYDIQHEIKQKEKAIKMLSKKYVSEKLTSSDIEKCLYSIGDNHSFLRGARDPIDKMIVYLTAYFSPDHVDGDYSLAIAAGVNGARLTHNHARQYHYVLQSLILWREVTHDMFKLWILAEEDLLETGNSYRLKDTGQGLNRIQPAHRISKAMTAIVNKVQSRVGDNWVGSSVVHLGDHNVPNALMFIDKYTQISRILNPIIIALRRAADIMKDSAELRDYVEFKFGTLENCRKTILCDFFKFAFDGSGADNFFDAGSCIDGRLTSAWHWCSQIDKKAFYPIFLLTGFIGFDGQF